MEGYRLKNIIISILVLLNGCLLLSLWNWISAEHSAQQQVTEQLVALFAADGVSLDPDIIPSQSPPASLTLTRDDAQERELASYFLGNGLSRSELSGGVQTYDGSDGAAVFQADGSFEISAGYLPVEDPEAFCADFCRQFGYQDLTFSLEDGSGSAAAVQYFYGFPVINATVTFSFDAGTLVTVTGTHLPETVQPVSPSSQPLSAAAALNAFLSARRETGAVVRSVLAVDLCYELQSSTAVPMTLTPSWRISTDTVTYHVDCITGAVTHG